jgi:hypothetical protein
MDNNSAGFLRAHDSQLQLAGEKFTGLWRSSRERLCVPGQFRQLKDAADGQLNALDALVREGRLESVDLVEIMRFLTASDDDEARRSVDTSCPEHDGVGGDNRGRSSKRPSVPPSNDEQTMLWLQLPSRRSRPDRFGECRSPSIFKLICLAFGVRNSGFAQDTLGSEGRNDTRNGPRLRRKLPGDFGRRPGPEAACAGNIAAPRACERGACTGRSGSHTDSMRPSGRSVLARAGRRYAATRCTARSQNRPQGYRAVRRSCQLERSCVAVRRDEIDGLYNSFHRENLPSILAHGILSHDLARKIEHRSIADPDVQDARARKIVPPSRRPLHSYANLYVNPRNTVGYRFVYDTIDAGGTADEICAVRTSLDVLDLPGVIVTDRNAASWPQWMTPEAGLAALDHAVIFAHYWSGKDHAQRMCAEVLVPDKVPPEYITDVYVCSAAARAHVEPICGDRSVHVRGRLFFR